MGRFASSPRFSWALAAVLTPLSCARAVDIVLEDGEGGGGGAGGAGGATGSTSSTAPPDAGTDAPPGACTGAQDCAGLSTACTVGICMNGTCTAQPANELGACDDGLYCTVSDHCTAGACVSGGPNPCPSDDACHVGVCNEATKGCDFVPGNDGAACDDADPCTGLGFCGGGTCKPGNPVDCSFLDGPCTAGQCDPSDGCVAVPVDDGAACDDGLYCTVEDACAAGKCKGVPNTCAAPGDVCLVGTCDEAADECTAVPGPDGVACNDKSTCTKGETCTAGKCGGGNPTNEGGACDDGNACTKADACAAGACTGTPIVQCANGDGCCPQGCALETDDDCNCDENLAFKAKPSISSGGSVAPYTVDNMNNGVDQSVCEWAWIDNNVAPSGAWIQYDWPAPVTIGSFYIDTENATNPKCPNAPAGRNIASGTVQWWDGAKWVAAGTFSGKKDDFGFDLVPPVTTTKLRLYDLTTDPGNGNSIIYEWYVYGGPGCVPEP